VAAIRWTPLLISVAQSGPSLKINVCAVIENGTTKAIPRTLHELRIYVVSPAAKAHGLPPDPGPSERWR